MGKQKYDWAKINEQCHGRVLSTQDVCREFSVNIHALYDALALGKIKIVKPICSCQTRYDWNKIQKDIDSGFTQREIIEKHRCSFPAINGARKTGKIKTRNRSDATILSRKKNPQYHTEATKKKISKIRKQYIVDHPNEAPYLLNHHSKGPSYPEIYFAELFEKENVKLERYYRFGTYQLDFADVNNKVDIEIDGSQHRFDSKIVAHDIKRNNFMASQGWRVFRVYWPEYQKKSYNERSKVISELKKVLGL